MDSKYIILPNEIKNESRLQNFRTLAHILGIERINSRSTST